MTVKEMIDRTKFKVLSEGDLSRIIYKPFCCDLLSVAMSKMPENAAWVTVMGNVNTLAVATLTECAVVIMAEGTDPGEDVIKKAKEQSVNLLQTDMPIFEAATFLTKLE